MMYSPEHHSIEELLRKAGYSEKGASMGWILAKENNQRFHAITNRGVIDIHFDRNEEGKHKASKFSHKVGREIRRLQNLDTNA